jgi:hypothetical protein
MEEAKNPPEETREEIVADILESYRVVISTFCKIVPAMIPVETAAPFIGLSSRSVYRILAGDAEPDPDRLVIMSDFCLRVGRALEALKDVVIIRLPQNDDVCRTLFVEKPLKILEGDSPLEAKILELTRLTFKVAAARLEGERS